MAAGIVPVPRGSWAAVGSPQNCSAKTVLQEQAEGGRAGLGCGEHHLVPAPVHPTQLLLLLQPFVPLPGVRGVPGPFSQHLHCQQAHLEPMAVLLLSPIKSSRGSCSAPSSLGTAGLEDVPPDPFLGAGLGSAQHVSGTAALQEEPKVWCPKARQISIPRDHLFQPLRLRHQTFTDRRAGTFLGIDVFILVQLKPFPC